MDKVNNRKNPVAKKNRNNKFGKAKKPQWKPKTGSLIDEKCDWNGSVFPFKGTKQLMEHEAENRHSDYEDDDWSPSNVKCNIKLNNALGALMGAYMSGDDSEDEIDAEYANTKQEKTKVSYVKSNDNAAIVQTDTLVVCNENDDDYSPPTEVNIVKENTACVVEETSTNVVKESTVTTRKRRRTHLRQRINKNNLKLDRGNQQMSSQRTNASSTSTTNFPYKFKRRKVTLLEKLLDNEIRHERNVLLQCVRYVVSNNFFDKM